MKIFKVGTTLGLAAALAGCATSSKVQEMIDASERDFLQKSEKNASSITILKQTAKASIEKNREQAETIRELTLQLTEAEEALATLRESVEAAKVLTASSVVKTSELKDAVDASRTSMEGRLESLGGVDELYEKVLIAHFQAVADSANAAIATLEADNRPDVVEAPGERDPILIDKPIEIIAPDTSTPTNGPETDG